MILEIFLFASQAKKRATNPSPHPWYASFSGKSNINVVKAMAHRPHDKYNLNSVLGSAFFFSVMANQPSSRRTQFSRRFNCCRKMPSAQQDCARCEITTLLRSSGGAGWFSRLELFGLLAIQFLNHFRSISLNHFSHFPIIINPMHSRFYGIFIDTAVTTSKLKFKRLIILIFSF